MRIAIELNHVVRNINRQILKYYQKDFDHSLDIDEIDDKDDVFKHVKFKKSEKRDFLYVDYPYEVFGCAKACEKNLPSKINKWLYDLTNYEDDKIDVFYYSLGEDALTIQSSYFFLSKIGTRVRKVLFPIKDEDVLECADVIVSADNIILDKAKNDYGLYTIHIKTNFNGCKKCDFDAEYDTLSDMIEDKGLLKKLLEYREKIEHKNNWINRVKGFFKK